MSEPTRKMSRWGIGTPFTLLSLGYGAGVCYVHWRWFPDLNMIWPPPTVGAAMALLFLAGGLIVFVAGLLRLNSAWREDRLETEGIYAWVRHPIYSAFILFLIPAVVLLSRHVLCLTIPFFMYIVFRILIAREEAYLAERFGDEYLKWRRRTSAVLPSPPIDKQE